MKKIKIILVGGFLGSGKTTMLWNAAKHLSEQGKKVGLITNDQASELVDTSFLESTGGVVSEVSGSCFCCNFNGFTEAIQQISGQGIDVIVAEPVGSCTDLSATILQPLKEHFADSLSVAPLSIMADAERLEAILEGKNSGLHKSAAYIVRKQMEEADQILINKIDLLDSRKVEVLKEKAQAAFPKAEIYTVSALEDKNVESWLEVVQNSEKAGTHLLEDIDYEIYAEGEAVLGWLNATVELQTKGGNEKDWKEVLENFLNELSEGFDSRHQAVGHVKALIRENCNFVVGNVVGKRETLKIRGASNGDPCVTMVLNARVEISPMELERAVRETISNMEKDDVKAEIREMQCLQPGRPNPTHRYDYVV
ncbi:MAG: GTP-binding protein [Fusicatenibacter sp.]|nr:cobalamin synthesis protein P47K [Fusicatenibacter sp.]